MRRPLLALCIFGASSAILAQEDFYLQRLADGRRFFEAKDYPQAAINFRIAGFGLMKSPARYEEVLVWLALSDQAAGRTDALKETLLRVLFVEDRFPGSYDAAALRSEQRQAFETMLLVSLPAESLRGASRFARLIRTEEQKIEDLAPAARHRAYEKRAKEEPAEGKWDLENARLYLREGQAKQAEKFVRRALAAGSKDDRAVVVRASALARLSRCPDAVSAFEGLSRERWETDPEARADYGMCLARVGRSGEAVQLLTALPEEIASRPPVARALAEARAKVSKTSPKTASDTNSVESLLSRARERLDARDLGGTEKALQEALEIAPSNRNVLLRLGELRYLQSAWKSGAVLLADLEPFRNDEAAFQFYYAVCLYNLGRKAEAKTALLEALPRLPSTPTLEKYSKLILAGERKRSE